MSLPNELLPVGLLGAGAAGGYEIERSLRFNSADSAYLSKTFASAGNRKTWTWAGWVKRSAFGSRQDLMSSGTTLSQFTLNAFGFISTDKLSLQYYGGTWRTTTAVFRDPSAWYHIVLAFDTTQSTAGDRIKLYVNGIEVTAFDTNTAPSQNTDFGFNSTEDHNIGRERYNGSFYFNGYLADVHFIDGQALAPTDFGEFDATTGVWNPIEYTGTYPGNSFHLDFADNSTNAALGNDVSGAGNNWTVNNISVSGGTGSYSPLTTVTGSTGLSGQLNIFDGLLATYASNTLSADNFILFTPTTGITYSSSLEVYCYAPNGYNITMSYSLNGGTQTSFVGGAAGFNGFAWITVATGSGTLNSLRLRMQRPGDLSTVGWAAIRIDGVILTDSSVPSVAAGNDSLVDTPTNYGTDTGIGGEVRGNYATLNPLSKGASTTLSNGNLDYLSSGSTSTTNSAASTLGVESGKWYWEVTLTSGSADILGAVTKAAPTGNGLDPNLIGLYFANGDLYNQGSSSSYGLSFTTNDVLGIALDVDAGKIWFSKNGSWMGPGSPDPATGTSAAVSSGIAGFRWFADVGHGGSPVTRSCSINFGQRPFAYTAPSGFKALCTQNLPTPTIADGSTAMDVVTYTGNGTTNSITGLGFSPDLVWIKSRNIAYYHRLNDSVRGAQKFLYSNATDAEVTSTLNDRFVSFDSTGFTLGIGDTPSADGLNQNTLPYVAWAWDAGSSTVTNNDGTISSQVRANDSAGFSIVTFTYPSSGSFTVGHGLGVPPSLIIAKHRNRSQGWLVYHSAVTSNNQYLILNATDAVGTATNVWGTSAPTSTVFGNTTGVSGISGDQELVYCFAPVAGYSAFGSYTGNGSADGSFIYLGFLPKVILIKITSTSGDWSMFDNSRIGYNPRNLVLYPNLSSAEVTTFLLDITSNGFKIRSSNAWVNTSAATYVYAAFAENPFSLARAR